MAEEEGLQHAKGQEEEDSHTSEQPQEVTPHEENLVANDENLNPIQVSEESNDDTNNNDMNTSPNVILILADDLGFGDLSISGHPTSR